MASSSKVVECLEVVLTARKIPIEILQPTEVQVKNWIWTNSNNNFTYFWK